MKRDLRRIRRRGAAERGAGTGSRAGAGAKPAFAVCMVVIKEVETKEGGQLWVRFLGVGAGRYFPSNFLI